MGPRKPAANPYSHPISQFIHQNTTSKTIFYSQVQQAARSETFSRYLGRNFRRCHLVKTDCTSPSTLVAGPQKCQAGRTSIIGHSLSAQRTNQRVQAEDDTMRKKQCRMLMDL